MGIDNLNNLADLWDSGCTAFKIFLCESGSKEARIDDGLLIDVFREVEKFKGTVILHCESESILQYNSQKLKNTGRQDYKAFSEWRSKESEAEAINRALFLLSCAHIRAVILHTTISDGVDMVSIARQKGMDVWVESCPHNLFLTQTDLEAKGPWVTFAPPVRDHMEVALLWQRLREGKIHIIGSDHNAVHPKNKEIGINNIWEGIFGIPDTETLVPLMLDAVSQGLLPLSMLPALLSENPAKIYGLYPRKGVISIGSDADFTIVDLSRKWVLKAEDMYTSCKWIPYEGKEIMGKVIYTILRGKIVMEDGIVIGEQGDGHFISRG